jgi:hypothetical protein
MGPNGAIFIYFKCVCVCAQYTLILLCPMHALAHVHRRQQGVLHPQRECALGAIQVLSRLMTACMHVCLQVQPALDDTFLQREKCRGSAPSRAVGTDKQAQGYAGEGLKPENVPAC